MTSKTEQSFAAAMRAAENAPDSDDAWDHLEELAENLQRPEEVAELYRDLLGRGLPRDVTGPLAERAVNFHEEWFGDEPEVITNLLADIIERDPEAQWAFDRLTVTLTASEEWDKLLGVYDRTLAATKDDETKKRLLDDAAHVAKDFADQQERAADYMVKQLELDRGNSKLEASLARLLERQERWSDLIQLWRGRLPQLSPIEARELRVEIAACYLDKLGDPQKALDELESLLEESAGHQQACAQLERLLEHDEASLALRRRALSLLRRNYDAAERSEDVIRVLERALNFVNEDEKAALHRELGTRLGIAGEDSRAMQHYAGLLTLDPGDADARKQLRQLAERSGEHDLHAASLVAAAESSEGSQRTTLLLEAAHAYRDLLDDTETAIELYSRVLDSEEPEQGAALAAAHSLAELLAGAGEDAKRLDVLETLAGLERASAVRKTILGDAARLAARLDQPDRALANWNRRLEMDAEDLEARDALVELLETNERWAELVDALRKRAATPVIPQQRRADLIRAAKLLSERLGDEVEATKTWLEVREHFGDEPETLDALDTLMAKAQRWAELAELLDSSAGVGRERAARTFVRIADIQREHLGDPDAAALSYARALGVEPGDSDARAGLRALLEVESCQAEASGALARAFRATGDWQASLEILDERLNAAPEPEDKARLLREAAKVYETKAQDDARAHELAARALPFAPEDVGLEHYLLRLAEETGEWGTTADAFQQASAAAPGEGRSAELLFAAGRIRENHLGDPGGATDAYSAAAQLDPRRIDSQEAVSRCAARAGRWDEAASAGLLAIIARESPGGSIVSELESAAEAAGAYPQLAEAFEKAIGEQGAELTHTLARALELIVARWWEATGAHDRAASAALRAVDHEPSHPDALAALARLQSGVAGPELVQTLLRLDALAERNLDHLRRAGETALEAGDEHLELARQTLIRLYRKAARMWSRGDEPEGELTPDETARWALDELVRMCAEAGELDQAVRLLLDGATLPVDPETSREMRRRAAEMLAEDGEYGRAIDLYTGILAEDEPRLEDIARVATLCEQEDRVSELIGLRLRELEMSDDGDRRLELRLELSRLTGVLEARGGRVETLRENLEERPGHAESIEALSTLLDQRGRYDELVEVLTTQAGKVAEAGQDSEAAASLYHRAAMLSEERLDDPERAIAAYARVVELAPSHAALDALARLYRGQDRPDEAARYLEQRLSDTPESERVAILLKLARARIAAEQREKAVQALETAFGEAPRNGEVRKLLIRLHRERDDREALARTLSTAATAVGDPNTVVAYAREAAELFEELGTPERSVPVLERAHEFAPDDRRLKQMLADGLRGAGRLDEARTLLEDLIESFGRRRSAQRAEAHVRLARVAHAQEKVEEAIDQLEKASKMAAGDVSILRALAETAHSAGQLDRAERAYRTLLLSLRRASEDAPITTAEVYLELSNIAKDKDDAEKAEELRESVLEAVAEDDSQAPKLQKALRKRGEFELLQRVLQTRLANVEAPRRRAKVLSALGDVLEHDLKQDDAALDARLQAVETDASSPLLHDAVKELAIRLGKTERYSKLLEDRLATLRRGGESLVRCELLLRLGEVMESREEYGRAAELYAQADATGVRQVDVWRAQARIAGATGDNERQVELLGRLANLGADQAETRADARFRMAEVHLADAESIDEGISDLNAALEDDPRWGRAAMILSRACDQHGDHEQLLDLYERVARRSNDPKILLHCLELRVRQPDADLDRAKEAVEIALALEDWERAEELMLRAVELSESVLDGLARVDWAMLGLAERRREAGDLAGAVKWLTEAAEVADLEKVLPAAQKLAEVASDPQGDLTLAVKLYESLVERDPTIRAAWEPLARLYTQLGEVDHLERLVEETLDGIQEAADRNVLRLQLARALLRSDDRADDAVPILNDALLENPEETEANLLLAEHLERSGKTEELLDLLRNQLMAAQGRGDAEAIKTLSIELASRLRADDLSEALMVIRQGLDNAPEDADLITTLLDWGAEDIEDDERATLMERRLAGASEDKVGQLAIELAELRATMGDNDGELRALEQAHQRVPEDVAVRERLEQAYRATNDFRGLVRLLESVAERTEDPARRVALLREAAAVTAEELSDPEAAIQLLRKASEAAPDDVRLRIDLAAALGLSGQADDAITTLSQTLESTEEPGLRLQLLAARAKVFQSVNRLGEAIEDLEAAHQLPGAEVGEALEQALEARRMAAAADEDAETERAATMRLVALRQARGANAEARELLVGWVDRQRKDLEALHLLREIELAEENWEGLVTVTGRLVALESDEAQVEAALLLSRACRALEQPGEARKGLEFARRKQPEVASLRAELRTIYAEVGATRELADLLIEETDATEDAAARLDLLRRAAKLYLELEDPASAAIPLQAILEMDPSDAETVGLLADAYTQSGQYEEAEAIIDAAIEAAPAGRSPELALLQVRKARLAEARGDRETQLTMLQNAFGNDKQNGYIAAELADLAEELEQWELATKVLRQIALMEGDCPITRAMSFVRQGRISMIQGDLKRAVFWARRAHKEDPELQEANELLAQVQS